MLLNHSKLLTVLILLLSLAGCGSDLEPLPTPTLIPTPTPSSTPITTVPNVEAIDNAAESFMFENSTPGLSVGIVVGKESPIFWSREYGVLSINHSAPVTQKTAFWQGSVSKAVMGTAIAIAQEKGYLSLEDSVHTLLASSGEFSLGNPSMEDITIEHLVTHTSGIADFWETYACTYFINGEGGEQSQLYNLVEEGFCPDTAPTGLRDFLYAYLNPQGQYYNAIENFSGNSPGAQFQYSNIGAALAGFALELATGQSLAEFAMQEIFIPLGMEDTSWRYSDLDSSNVAAPHVFLEDDDGIEELQEIPNYEIATWPDGGLRSTPLDLLHLLAALMNGGQLGSEGTRILSGERVEAMLTERNDGIGIFWFVSGELEVSGEIHHLIGHTGGDPGAHSCIAFDPENSIGIVVVGNGDDVEETSMHALVSQLMLGAKAMISL